MRFTAAYIRRYSQLGGDLWANFRYKMVAVLPHSLPQGTDRNPRRLFIALVL